MFLQLVRPLAVAALLIFAFGSKAHAQAAAPNDEAQIRAVVNSYFEGWALGDTVRLSAAMHASCHLKFVRNNEFGEVNKQTYLSGFKPQPKGDVQARILTLRQTGHAAGIVSEITTGSSRYTDYFNLLRIKGRWYIVDKVAYREEVVAATK